jgi:hypothetical protein
MTPASAEIPRSRSPLGELATQNDSRVHGADGVAWAIERFAL